MKWTFSKKDLEKVKYQWENKKERIDFWREYSLKDYRSSELDKINNFLNALESLEKNIFSLDSQIINCEEFFFQLNNGNYHFSPFEVVYFLDKYYIKSRIAFQINKNNPSRFQKKFLDLLVCKLVANKLKILLHEDSKKQRNQAVLEFIKKLRQVIKYNSRIAFLKGDFRSYTQNIPRDSLISHLKAKEVPPHIIKLIKSYLDAGTYVSKNINNNLLNIFFKELGFGKFYEEDTDFRVILNKSGIMAGIPISNVLGNIFLLDFDKQIKEYLNGEGFYTRYFDDFIIAAEENKIKEIKKNIPKILFFYYPFNYKTIEDKIIRLETTTISDFLGYLIKIDSKNRDIFVTVRYKTLKKFIYKYLYEYNISKKYKKNISKFLIGKCVYLTTWIYSFLCINDTNLLDLLYTKIILPDLYRILQYNSTEVKKLKQYYKPVIIYRQLLKNRDKNNSLKERINYIKENIKEQLKK